MTVTLYKKLDLAELLASVVSVYSFFQQLGYPGVSQYACIPVVSGASGSTPLLNGPEGLSVAGFPILVMVSGLLCTSGLHCTKLVFQLTFLFIALYWLGGCLCLLCIFSLPNPPLEIFMGFIQSYMLLLTGYYNFYFSSEILLST